MNAALDLNSTPSFSNFDPTVIPYQDQVIDDVLCQYDYSLGLHEVLLSGAVGSAKSILMAHLGLRHVLTFPRSRLMLGRKSMPDLRSTIFAKILEHMEDDLVEGVHYWLNETTGTFTFRNKSQIICRSWADGKYKRFRSLELSAAIIEELTENDEKDRQAYKEIRLRIGRLPHVTHNWLMSATNPDSPQHWAYDYFELGKDESLAEDEKTSALGLGPNQDRTATKHVYYSITDDNPFLPDSYKRQLKSELDPREYLRMGRGRWIELKTDGVYHAYDKAKNYKNTDYMRMNGHAIICAWDFNIADGKPLSAVVMQYDGQGFHIFGEVVVEGIRTEDSLDELAGKGFFDLPDNPLIIVCGDASGKHRDTRSKRSDYDIIKQYLANYLRKDGLSLTFEMNVPMANPPIRKRHNIVNAYCCNELGQHRLFVYPGAPTVDKGLRLTALKDNGKYIEDDSKPWQHITTALGYAVVATINKSNFKTQGMVQL